MNHDIKPSLLKILQKLSKKDKKRYKATLNKINEIINCENPNHYKNLRHDMKQYKRVHIDSYVLIFKIEKDNIIFTDLQHHDVIYRRK